MENRNIEYIEGLVQPDSFKKLIPSSDETKNIIPILVGNNFQSYQYDIFKFWFYK